MKLNIKREVRGDREYVVGWELVPETKEESNNLALVRDVIFFGLRDLGTYPEYDGREGSENPDFPVGKLKWKIPKSEWYRKIKE